MYRFWISVATYRIQQTPTQKQKKGSTASLKLSSCSPPAPCPVTPGWVRKVSRVFPKLEVAHAWNRFRLPKRSACIDPTSFWKDMGIKKATPSSLISAFSTEKKRPATFARRIHKASWLHTGFSRPLERGCVNWTMTKYVGLDVHMYIYIYNIYKETVTVCKNYKSTCYARGSTYNTLYMAFKDWIVRTLSELPAFSSPFQNRSQFTHLCVKKLNKRYGHHWEFSRVLPAPPFMTPGMMTARLEANHSIIQKCLVWWTTLAKSKRNFLTMSNSHFTMPCSQIQNASNLTKKEYWISCSNCPCLSGLVGN